MNCKECGTENAGWRSFCSQCGHLLGILCRCAFPNQPGDNYCGGCGQPLVKDENKFAKGNEISQKHFLYPQLGDEELKALISESLLIKFGESEPIKQNDIDSFFK